MPKYYISIDKNCLLNFGDKNGNLFNSEREAWEFLKELNDNGDICLIEEENYVPHGCIENNYILLKGGFRYQFHIEGIMEFNPDCWEKNPEKLKFYERKGRS